MTNDLIKLLDYSKAMHESDTALLRDCWALLLVATFHSPKVQAERTEVVNRLAERLK